MSYATDVVILGGGIIGLGIAWELARRGASVTVLEREMPGHAASWAAAGMLAPYTEDLADAALLDLAIASLRAYPAYAEALQAASDVDIHLRLHGILEVAYDQEHAVRLQRRVQRLSPSGVQIREVPEHEIADAAAAVARRSYGAVLCAEEGQVDNRRLGRALSEASRRAGVLIRPNVTVERVECNARRVLGVETNVGFLAASCVVNALGAWSGRLEGLPAHACVPVSPVKGQMLALAMPYGYLQRVVWANGVYLVPREDGRLIVGATVEQTGFDHRLTAAGIHRLLDGVLRVLPGAASFALSETWSGLRPGTPDGRPFLGRTELDGYIVATGHYRNGVLLTPITATTIADDITGVKTLDPAFSLARLQRGEFQTVAKLSA